MTKKELNELKYLKEEIKMLEVEIKEMRNTLKGVPFGTKVQTSAVSDTVSKTAEMIVEKEGILNESLLICIGRENEILRRIEAIPDSRIRQIIKYRYVDNLSWIQTGQKMKASVESLKMALKRFEEREEFYGEDGKTA